MRAEIKKAQGRLSGSTCPEKNNQVRGIYLLSPEMSSQNRLEKIKKRRANMPKAYRGIYDRAVSGKSLRAAINAQCLECVCWQRREVTLCTDLACPIHTVRPYRISQDGHDEGFIGAESKNSDKGVIMPHPDKMKRAHKENPCPVSGKPDWRLKLNSISIELHLITFI